MGLGSGFRDVNVDTDKSEETTRSRTNLRRKNNTRKWKQQSNSLENRSDVSDEKEESSSVEITGNGDKSLPDLNKGEIPEEYFDSAIYFSSAASLRNPLISIVALSFTVLCYSLGLVIRWAPFQHPTT